MNQFKKKLTRRAAFFAFSFSVALVPQVALASAAQNGLLAQVRAATAKYHNVENAIAAGYSGEGQPCVPGMGYHYVNASLAAPGSGVTELEPEVLLYVDTPNGGKRLVGVEYLEFALPIYVGEPPAPDFVSTNPVLFDGVEFFGPMEGHDPSMPWHYDLHVWIWSHNPDGIFATLNPNITCQ